MNELSKRIRAYAVLCSQRPVAAPKGPTSEVDPIADVVGRTFRRYQTESRPGTVAIPILRLFETRRHCSAFLFQSGFYDNLPTTNEAAEVFGSKLSAELSRAQSSVKSLVLIDGLGLPIKEVRFNGGRLFELNDQSIREWLDGNQPPRRLLADCLEGVAALEVVAEARNPPWEEEHFEWESAARQVEKVAEPWLTYLNLFEGRKCRTAGMYQQSDSLLHLERVRDVGVQEPMRRTDSFPIGDGEYEEVDRLYRTLEVDDEQSLVSLLNFLEAGRVSAAQRGSHRVETALRYFSKVSELALFHDLALVPELNQCEDIIINAVIGLEAIYLKKREGGKKAHLSARAAALLESRDALQEEVRADAAELYRVRSAIVHGDAREGPDTLQKASRVAEQLLRRSIIAFCGAEGDQSRVLQAETDQRVATEVRDRIPI